MSEYKQLSINQVTTREQWSLSEAIAGYARHGIHGIAVWRDKLQQTGIKQSAALLREHDMTVTGYCIGGLLASSADDSAWQACIDDNRRVIDEAAAINSRCVVFIGGGLPTGSKDLAGARARFLEGLQQLLPHAKSAAVTLALEPLHPMVCALRACCLVTMREANDICDELNTGPELGIAIDTYNVWWDPELEAQIKRAGEKNRIAAFHVSDWLADTQDLRLDRGMMGDGVIDIIGIRRMLEVAGYNGMREVEIFSARNWWRRDPDDLLAIIKERYLLYV